MALKRDGTTDAVEGTSNDTGFENFANNWIAPDPVTKPTVFSGGGEDPLAQLDSYCRSRLNTENATATTNSSNTSVTSADADELLSVAEFLFGQKALKAALTIVDSRRSLITKLVAPSGRSLRLIRSSSTSSKPAMDYNDANFRIDGEHYLCLLSPSQSSRSVPPVRYCSCRSFLEKSTKKLSVLASVRAGGAHRASNASIHDENFHDGPPVCKHLLALFLLPHLDAASSSRSHSGQSSYREVKSITEQEFARFVLDRVL